MEKNIEIYRDAATALNINMYYGVLAKAEGRQNDYKTAMYIVSGTGQKIYKSHITPEELEAMTDTEKILYVSCINGKKKYRSYTKENLTENDFTTVRDKFLKSDRTADRARKTKTDRIYLLLYNAAKKLKEAEDAYYDKLAEEHAAESEYLSSLQYGHCNDTAWQAGM